MGIIKSIMKIGYIIFFLCSFFYIANGYGQEILKEKLENKRLQDLSKQLEGTYQFQVINSREKPAIGATYMDSIQNKRQQNDKAYLWLSKNVRIMILPYTVINKPGFTPLESIKYQSSTKE